MLDVRWTLEEPNVVNEEFDGEFVVLNLSDGTYFSFKGSGDLLWRALLDGVAPQGILDALRVSGSSFGEAALRFFDRVAEFRLMRAATLPPIAVGAGLTASLAAISEAPEIEMYADLADLLTADPIHDADAEIGWPAPKPADA